VWENGGQGNAEILEQKLAWGARRIPYLLCIGFRQVGGRGE